MLNYNTYSKIISIFFLYFLSACSPLKEKQIPAKLVELEYTDPKLAQQFSNGADHSVSGNLVYEIQQDLVTGKSTVYATASFHESTDRNVLFDKVPTSALDKMVYKPKPPVDQPCGIPGFPDCPATGTPPSPPGPVTPTPPASNPDQPCGIPGFPDCPVTIDKK